MYEGKYQLFTFCPVYSDLIITLIVTFFITLVIIQVLQRQEKRTVFRRESLGFKKPRDSLFEEKTGGVDMCKAMERKEQHDKIIGAIQGMRKLGANDDSIINAIIEMFGVTKDYVIALLKAQVA